MSQQWKPLVYLLLAFGAYFFGPTIAERLVVGFDGGDVMILVQERYYMMLLNLIAPFFLVVIFIPLYEKHNMIGLFPLLWMALLALQHKLYDIQSLSLTLDGTGLYAFIILIVGITMALVLWKTSKEADSNDLRQTVYIVMGFVLFSATLFNQYLVWEYNTWFVNNDLVVLYAIINIIYSFGFYLVTALLVQQLFSDTKERNTAQ